YSSKLKRYGNSLKRGKKMLELLKNIGLGIFVNGAYALQFTENTFEGLLGSLEGIITMLFAIYTPKVLKGGKK
ncbi:MAG: hypothetical protein SPH02_04695, partial [Campylobacter sp.]|nr:hypothetical protein [Campylobacter sp.]